MKRSSFYEVLQMALVWDRVSDERFTLPKLGDEEMELFYHFLDMLNNSEVMDELSFSNYQHCQENANELPF